MRELIFKILKQEYLPDYFILLSFFPLFVKLGILVEDMF